MKRNTGKRYWFFVEIGDKKYLQYCSRGLRFKTREELRKALEDVIDEASKNVGRKTTYIVTIGYGSFCKPDEIDPNL
jgi:hypothetical protein